MLAKRRFIAFSIIAILCLSILNNIGFTANENYEEVLKEGIYQFRRESYDEALEIFKRVRKSNPNSSLAAYYLGLTYKRLENYVEAKPHLRASLSMTPKIKGALIELIDLLYRLDDIEEAKRWIRVAENEGVRPAQAAFLKGLTLLKAEEYEEAIEAFKDAKDLDSQLTQLADYQMAGIYIKMGRLRDAKKAFEEVLAIDPHADVSAYANRYIDAIDKKLEEEKPYNLMARFAFEYDSNVVLKPGNTSLIATIAEEDDTREIYDFRGDYTIKSPNKFLSLKAAYGLRLYDQNKLERYDVVSNSFGLQPSATFEKVLVSFPVNYTHNIVNDTTYLATTTAGNLNNIALGDSRMAQVGTIYKFKDYFTASSDDEDRSGNEVIGLGGLFWFFSNNEGFFTLRCSTNKDWTDGKNWEYWGTKAGAGLMLPFCKKFKLNTQAETSFQFYDNTHTTFDEKRRDQVYSLSSLLSYEIYKNTELHFQYTYVNNQSNLEVHEYDRHIFGTAVQIKL